MAVRNLKLIPIEAWAGFNQLTDAEEVTPAEWSDSLNWVVLPNGNPCALRSPANFNTALATGNKVVSGAEYDRTAGPVLIFDINNSSGANVRTYVTTVGGVNTLLRSGQADAAWQSLNVNDALYRVNGSEFIQYVTSFAAYLVGIAAPAAAPTVAVSTGGSGVLTTGVYISYAYYNSSTGHIGEASATSALSGPTTATDMNLRVGLTASSAAGVTNTVLFVSQDGGTLRYLLIDSDDEPQLFANTTGTVTVAVASAGGVFQNLNVEETVFNAPPPAGITFISQWKNRIVGALGRLFVYSGFDQIAAGVPQESWPPLNVVTIPNKSEQAQGGIETPIGWLGLSDRDAYLLSGTPTDKVDSGENTIQVTEQFTPLGWKIGTRSPKSIQNTPFGTVWLDQNKQLQVWPWQDNPRALAAGIWPDLADIQDTDAIRGKVQGLWFPAPKVNGGFYVLVGSTSGSTNNRCWIVTMVETPNGLRVSPAPSSIAAECIFSAEINGERRCFIGVTDRLREIMDFDLAGAGWASTDTLYFQNVIGNQMTNFNRLHSLRLDATNAKDLRISVSNLDGSMSGTIRMMQDGGDWFGMVDRYGTRHRVEFAVPNDDLARRELKNVRFAPSQKQRVI